MKFNTYATIGIATFLMLVGSLCQSITRWIDGGIYSVAIAFADSGTEENPKGSQTPGGAGSGQGAQASEPSQPSSSQPSGESRPYEPSKRNYIKVPPSTK